MLRGEPLEDLSREYGVEVAKLELWRDKAIAGMEAGLKDRTGDALEAELENAKADSARSSWRMSCSEVAPALSG
jgi:hypothetical protein